MTESLLTAAVGSALVLGGVLMLAAHQRTWRAHRLDPEVDEFDLNHYRRRHRRRVQTSALIVVIGLLVGLSPVAVPDFKEAPKLFTGWWIATLGLALWIIALALADIASTRAHSSITLARLRVKQQELERQLGELRRGQSNGRGPK